MNELTDEEKADCQKILDRLVAYWWSKLKVKMLVNGTPYEEAVQELMKEMLE
jgi:hypothetical protein